MKFYVYCVEKRLDITATPEAEYRLNDFKLISKTQLEEYANPSAAIYDAAVAVSTVEVVRGEQDYLKLTEIIAEDEEANVLAASAPQESLSVGGRQYTNVGSRYMDLSAIGE